MIPRLFRSDATEFDNLGYGGITRAVSCYVVEELNGTYELHMKMLVDDPLYEFVQVGNIIVALPSMTSSPQAFVIEEVSKEVRGEIDVYATHIAQHRTKFVPIINFGTNALGGLVMALNSPLYCKETNPFTFVTDMESSTRFAQNYPRSLRDMMGGTRNSILDVYGGEYEYDNFIIALKRRRGRETDARVMYGHNMTEFRQDDDFSWNNSATGVYPYYYTEDGYVIGDVQYSIYKDLYPYAKTVTVDFTDRFEAIPTKAELNAYASSWINKKGLPATTLTCSFNQFESDSIDINTLSIGDTVTVINKLYGVNYESRIVAMNYDVLADKYNSITVGSLKETIWSAIAGAISQESASGGVSVDWYGECSTAKGTAQKDVTITGFPQTLYEGLQVTIKFTNSNTVANPTLCINGETPVPIMRYGSTAISTSTRTSWYAGAVRTFVYDGTNWVIGNFNSDTTYSSMTAAEITAGTGTSARLITPANLKSAIRTWNYLTGVKGDAESTYRTGNVNITPTNIGAVPSSDVATGIASYGKIPKVGSDGVIELGKYIDFHLTNGDTDYALRITASADGLTLSGQSLTGSSGKLMTAGDFGDRVTETGTSGSWAYRKWESGKTEAWRTVTVTASATTQAGSVYRSTATVDLPSGLFNSAPHTIASMDAVGTNLFSVYATASSATNIDVRVWRVNASTATYGVNVSFYCWRG